MENTGTLSKDGPPNSCRCYDLNSVGSGCGDRPSGSSNSRVLLSELDINILELNRIGELTIAIVSDVKTPEEWGILSGSRGAIAR